jgi:hypothetical protein
MTRKQYREIQVKQKVNLTEQNRIHFLVNLNSLGFQVLKVKERKNRRLDYYTTLFGVMLPPSTHVLKTEIRTT